MYGISIAAVFALLLSGCGIINIGGNGPISNLIYRDVTRTLELANKYGDERMKACADFLKWQVDFNHKLLQEETDGLISRAFIKFLLAVDAQGKEAQMEEVCGPIVGSIAIKSLRQLR